MYNNNYILKNVGYFQNYIYKYKDYVINKNVLAPFLLKDKSFIIYISNKEEEENITGICNFNNYTEFIELLDTSINKKIKELDVKNIKNISIIIKIWIYTEIATQRLKETAQKEFDKKLIKFQKVLDKLIDYKVKVSNNQQQYSRFLTDKILTKELKPVLHIKVRDEEMQQECLKHLLNLMSKKWQGVTYAIFKLWVHKTIKLYQDNYEHNDAWEITLKEKEFLKNNLDVERPTQWKTEAAIKNK